MGTLNKAACCLLKALADVLAEEGLEPIEKMVPSHKGLDDHCEDCTGAYVSIPQSSPQQVFVEGTERCVMIREWTFQLDVLRKVCTEDLDCEQPDPGCQGDCPDITPETPPAPCTDGVKPTVSGETAYFWDEREALEKKLLKRWSCCLEECHH